MRLYNTPSRKIEEFTAITPNKVTLYTCGPTVYNYLHVGNWAAYIHWDTLVRTLQASGYDVTRTMNITDVGHLISDEDDGEDKMEKGARREGKSMWDIARMYTDDFMSGMDALGLIRPTYITKATDYIDQQIALVRTLKEKGFTYQINDGIYFDTSKFPRYAEFARLELDTLKAGARVAYNNDKKNPSDFALWKFASLGRKEMIWDTPEDLIDRDSPYPAQSTKLVQGFPGWHLECSAMAIDTLGETIDIHTGGIDHIPVHHTNEIAQSESATGKPFSRFWLHNNHIKSEGTKISKSLGNGYTLNDLQAKGYSPLDYRMFVLQSQYQTEGNFTWENLEAAKNRLTNWRAVATLRHQVRSKAGDTATFENARAAITQDLQDNLNTPLALTHVDELFAKLDSLDAIDEQCFLQFLGAIDDLFGLQLVDTTPDISEDLKRKIIERQRARDNQDWAMSDRLRDELLESGVSVRDTNHGPVWTYA